MLGLWFRCRIEGPTIIRGFISLVIGTGHRRVGCVRWWVVVLVEGKATYGLVAGARHCDCIDLRS